MSSFKIERHGALMASVRLTHLWSSVYGISLKVSSDEATIDDCKVILLQSIASAHTCGAQRLDFRLSATTPLHDSLAQQLAQMGFQRRHDRLEFRKALNDLPNDDGSPLVWKSALELAYDRNQIASAVDSVTKGDPDHDPSEVPTEFISDFLLHPELTAGPQCISLGFIDGHFAALAVGQVEPASGWSRISYMGIVPAFRSRGLGIWVHRHGFDLMRRQQGIHYHGGTSAENFPMIRLFEKHGCDFYRRMQEWRLPLLSGGEQ
jgi:hypothetical protein